MNIGKYAAALEFLTRDLDHAFGLLKIAKTAEVANAKELLTTVIDLGEHMKRGIY